MDFTLNVHLKKFQWQKSSPFQRGLDLIEKHLQYNDAQLRQGHSSHKREP